jgi:hypothetical protein
MPEYSPVEDIVKIRKLLNLNKEWETLAVTQKELKLLKILDDLVYNSLNFPLPRAEEFSDYCSNVKTRLEKDGLLINQNVDFELDSFIKRRTEIGKRSGDYIEIVTVHFSDSTFLIELFAVEVDIGISSKEIMTYFTVVRDSSKFRSEINSVFS